MRDDRALFRKEGDLVQRGGYRGGRSSRVGLVIANVDPVGTFWKGNLSIRRAGFDHGFDRQFIRSIPDDQGGFVEEADGEFDVWKMEVACNPLE